MAHEFVFVMNDLRKVVGEGRVILDQINLSFFPGAKIGVLGHNGAGKSTLLRIMAGLDTDFLGEARPLRNVGGLTAAAMLTAALVTFCVIPWLSRRTNYR